MRKFTEDELRQLEKLGVDDPNDHERVHPERVTDIQNILESERLGYMDSELARYKLRRAWY